jgi:hypothetical protein
MAAQRQLTAYHQDEADRQHANCDEGRLCTLLNLNQLQAGACTRGHGLHDLASPYADSNAMFNLRG